MAGGRGEPGRPRGVVLSSGVFLGPAEIASMRVVPDLVFVNCCHLAKRSPDEVLAPEIDRPHLAATLAEALISVGVRCVIAAGWAVRDDAAAAFAQTFYKSLVAKQRFIDAVADARDAARKKGGNSWAAYQCYGDPDWKLLRRNDEAPAAPIDPAVAFASIASPSSLTLALETLRTNSQYNRGKDKEKQVPAALTYLETRFASWGSIGAVAEAFGAAWAESDRARAIPWYERALAANDGSASLRAAEQLGNLRARVAAERAAREKDAGPTVFARAQDEIQRALRLLQDLCSMQTSIERENLCGSAYKRLAMVAGLAGDERRQHEAIVAMTERYQRAEDMARESGQENWAYPAINRMFAELIVKLGHEDWPGFDERSLTELRALLLDKKERDPDFWAWIGVIDLRLLEAMYRSRLEVELPALRQQYADLHARVGASRSWASAGDQLRFVLSACRALRDSERRAGQELLAMLDGFAAE